MFKVLKNLFNKPTKESTGEPNFDLIEVESLEVVNSVDNTDLVFSTSDSIIISNSWEDLFKNSNLKPNLSNKASLHKVKKLINNKLHHKNYLDIIYPNILNDLHFNNQDLYKVLLTLEAEGYVVELQPFTSEIGKKVIKISWR